MNSALPGTRRLASSQLWASAGRKEDSDVSDGWFEPTSSLQSPLPGYWWPGPPQTLSDARKRTPFGCGDAQLRNGVSPVPAGTGGVPTYGLAVPDQAPARMFSESKAVVLA